MTKSYPLPAEVKGLPPELEGVELTPRQKKKDEARRDQLMKLAGSAARLSPEDAELAHAHTRVDNYRLQLKHIEGLYLEKPKERGMTKAQLNKARVATAEHLAEALIDVGRYFDAGMVLNVHAPRSSVRKRIDADLKAIDKPDEVECKCPVEHLRAVRGVLALERTNPKLTLYHCTACGDLNARPEPPARLKHLHAARTEAGPDATDERVFGHARKRGVEIGPKV